MQKTVFESNGVVGKKRAGVPSATDSGLPAVAECRVLHAMTTQLFRRSNQSS